MAKKKIKIDELPKIDMNLGDEDNMILFDEAVFESVPSIKGNHMLDHEIIKHPNHDDFVYCFFR